MSTDSTVSAISYASGHATAYSLGPGNRLAATSDGAAYHYDAAGCLTNITASARTLDLTWNPQYQLTAATTNAAPAESYTYDPLGRRAGTTVDGTTTYHLYDGMHCIADLAEDGTVLRSYTWGPGIDNLLAITDHRADATWFALTDLSACGTDAQAGHLGTVHALVDANGNVVESYTYDAWGNVLAVHDASDSPLSTSAIGNRFLF